MAVQPTDCHDSANGNAAVKNWGDFFCPESFQNVPSLLLKNLTQTNVSGETILELQDIGVYALLKSHAQGKGDCYPSLERLARLANCSVSTVQRSLKRLENAGHIQRKSHNKGQIRLLTDVTRSSKIVRRERIIVVPPRREICPPEFQGGIIDARDEMEIWGIGTNGEAESGQVPPVSDEPLTPIEEEPLF
jgi:DNA-binding MarR family transcriptional regulator